MSELIVLNVITRSMFMDFKRSLNGNSIKKTIARAIDRWTLFSKAI